MFTGVVVRTAWLHVITEFRYSFTPSPLHKHWRQCLSKSISLWQRCSSLRTLEYAEACPLWSSRCFKNLICCFVKLTFPFTFRKSSAFITACHWASALKKCTLNGIVHLKLQFCHHLFILMLCQNCIHLYLLSKIRYFVSISFFFHKKKNPKDLLSSTEGSKSYRFGTTWGWVNDYRIFIFSWTVPLKLAWNRIYSRLFPLSWCKSQCNSFSKWGKKKVGQDLFLSIENWLDHCSLIAVISRQRDSFLDWRDSCLVLVPLYTSLEKSCRCEGWMKMNVKGTLIKNYCVHS